MNNHPSHAPINRRNMLKLSLASAGAAGLPLPRAVAAEDTAAGTGTVFSTKRKRPACLDLEWGKGTGLIWMAGESLFYENPRNRFMRFRRNFTLAERPQRAELWLFADTEFILWVNGAEVGRGPGRSDQTWTLFDTFDIAPLLKPGRNTLAVLALFHGFGTGDRRSIMQALLAHLKMEFAGGRSQFIVSDRSWKTSPAAEFIRPSPRLHCTLGCAEVQDLRLRDEGWQQPDFDDAKWAASDYVKTDIVNTPWYHFAPSTLPPRQLVAHPFPKTAAVAALTFPIPPVAELGAVRPVPIGDAQSALAMRLAPSGQAWVVRLDLGRTEVGYLTLDVTGPAGATIDVLVGEQFVAGRVPKPGAAQVHTNRFILREGRQKLEIAFNWIAFRYVQLWIWTAQPLEIHDAVLQRMVSPLGAAGHFKCNDEFLNKLDGICEHTLRLCSQDAIMDSSSRERQQWIGDGRFTAITLHHRFAAGALHRRMIEQIGQGIDWLGTMVPRYPTGNNNVSPIPLYNLQWILAFKDYELFTGDATLLADWLPLFPHVLRWFTAFERDDGLLHRVPHWMYIDLGESKPDRRPSVGEINTTLNLYYLAALRYAAQALAGDARLAAEMAQRAGRLAQAVRAVLWDAAAGAYRDSLEANGKPGTLSEVANANALVHLEEPGSARAAQILDNVFAQRRSNPIHASPFMMNAVFDALGRHGRADLVFPLLAARYPPQVESGSTWEHWVSHHIGPSGIPNGDSLSHAWGAGALAFFVNTVAGIQPAAPGWKSVRIAPQPGPLTRAEASVITVAGKIFAAWEISGGTFKLRVELPTKVGGTARLPDGTEVAIPSSGGNFSCAIQAAKS